MSSRTLEERLAALSPDARALLWRRLQRRGHELGSSDAGSEQLVAYFESRGIAPVSPGDLRRLLADRLPSFMVPSRFVSLDRLPTLPNGKVDRRALAERRDEIGVSPPPTAPPPPPAPDDRATRLLALWREMLGVPGLGPDDDFFEAGGDSILAMRLIARAARTGLSVTLAEFFRTPTASGMLAAAVKRPRAPTPSPPRAAGSRSGRPVPLSPIQHWFFEQNFAGAHRWSHVQLVEIPRSLPHQRLESVLAAVVERHEALRLAFVRKGGGWQQHVKPLARPVPVACVEAAAADPLTFEVAFERDAARLHDAMRLDSGLLLRALRVQFDGRAGNAARQEHSDLLYLTAHHLAVDIVSWSILLDDLETACRQLEAGGPSTLGAVTSFTEWAEALHAYAQGPEPRRDYSWWSEASRTAALPMPRDLTGMGPNDEASAEVVVSRLDRDDTARLLADARFGRQGSLAEYVLTGVVQSLAAWSGQSRILVGIEGHGRADLVAGLDVSHTVGWFTSYYPVVFELASADRPPDVLRVVRDRMREVPGQGLSYGVLRYLTADDAVTRQLAGQPSPDVIFNYVGQEGPARAEGAWFRPRADGFRVLRDTSARRTSLLDVTARVADGRLELACGYSRNIHRRETIEALVDGAARTVVALTDAERRTGGHLVTPSDFPDADLHDDELRTLIDPT